MKICIHCSHEGPDTDFNHYRDKNKVRRPTNICLTCYRRRAADRQARYKERHGDRVREQQRVSKYIRYHTDPEFRARHIAQSKKK